MARTRRSYGRLILVLLSSLLPSVMAVAQQPYALKWSVAVDRFVAASWDRGSDICADGEGNTYIVGRVGLSESGLGSYAALWTSKRDAQGQEVWSRKYTIDPSGRGLSQYSFIGRTNGGNIVVAGCVTGSNPYAIVQCYDGATGNTIWQTQFASTTVNDLAIDLAGNAFVRSTVVATGRPRVTKLDPQGNLLWHCNFPTTPSLECNAMALDPAGAPVLVGSRNGSSASACATKIDPATGTLLWTGLVNRASFSEAANHVVTDSAGDVYICGRTQGVSDDYLVAKFSGNTGQLLWSTAVDRANRSNEAKCIIYNASTDTLLVGGQAYNGSVYGICILRFNPSTGALVWQATPVATTDGQSTDLSEMNLVSNGEVVAIGPAGGRGFCARVEPALGALVWRGEHHPPTGFTSETAGGVCVDSNGSIVVTGELRGSSTGWNDSLWWRLAGSTGVTIGFQPLDGLVPSGDTLSEGLLDADFNSYLVGRGPTGVLITKIDQGGQEIWRRESPLSTTYPAAGFLTGAVSSSDGLFLCGNTPMSGTSNSNSFVTRLSTTDSTTQWESLLDFWPTGEDVFESIAIHPDGNLVLSGRADTKLVVAKITASTGTLIWSQVIEANIWFSQTRSKLRLTASGDVIVASPGWQQPGGNNGGTFTVKLDGANGTVLWTHLKGTLGGTEIRPNGLSLDASGNPAIACFTPSGAFTYKLNGTTGTQLWQHSPTGTTAESLVFDDTNALFVLGISRVNSVDTLTVYRYSASGTLTHTRTYPGPYPNLADRPVSIGLDTRGNVIATAVLDYNSQPVPLGAVLSVDRVDATPTLLCSFSVVSDIFSGIRSVIRTHSVEPKILFVNATYRSDLIAMKFVSRSSISGVAQLEGWVPGTSGKTVSVELIPVSSSDPGTYGGQLSANGIFQVDVAERGTYDVAIYCPQFLRRIAGRVTLTGDAVTLPTTLLLAGDCNSDNAIDIGDYAILSSAYESIPGDLNWDSRADINGDGVVDIGDYSLLSTNYGTVGD